MTFINCGGEGNGNEVVLSVDGKQILPASQDNAIYNAITSAFVVGDTAEVKLEAKGPDAVINVIKVAMHCTGGRWVGGGTRWMDRWRIDAFMHASDKACCWFRVESHHGQPISRYTCLGLSSSRLTEDYATKLKLDGYQCDSGEKEVHGKQADRAACGKSAKLPKLPYYSYDNGQTCASTGTCTSIVCLCVAVLNCLGSESEGCAVRLERSMDMSDFLNHLQ